MVQRASVEKREAYISSEFGEQMARRYFGDVVDTLPRYVRGARKGKLKGRLEWKKVLQGGWVSVYGEAANGYVERRVNQIIRVDLNLPEWGAEAKTVASWQWDHASNRDSARVKVYEVEAA